MAQLNSLIVTGNSKLIGDTNTNAIYAAGNIKIGTSTQSTLPTTGLTIHDVRNVDITANGLNRAMNVYFSNRTSPYPSATWYSAIHMQGWNGSESYNAWELIGPANNGDQRTQPLYVRSSNGGTWGSWRQIYDSSNHDGTKVNKSGDTMSGALNLSYTASATMTYASTNPQIGFSENGSQGVKIIYTDYDSYRAPYGLKVIGDNTAGAAWFEVEGSIFCNGGKYNSYFTATPTSGQVVITDGAAGGTKSSGYTIATSVPSGAKFTDTTYTFTGGTNSFTVTPLGASAQTVSLTVSDSTKLPLTGGTMTGDIIFNKTGATDLTQVQMKCGVNDYGRVAAGGTASNSGWMEIATADDGAEPIYARQYSGVYSSIVRTATLLDASGNTSFPGILSLSKTVRKMLTGTGTAAQDKGADVSPRYFPARWAFNIGIATPADGEIVTIKIPCAGHDYGVFLSLDNGTTYKPISVTYGVDRLTTHYGSGTPLTLIYDAAGTTNSVFAAAGADARSNITGGCWRVMNFYNTNSTYNFSGTTFVSGNQNTAEHNCNNTSYNGIYYYTSNGPSKAIGATTDDGALHNQAHSTNWQAQIAQDYRDGDAFVRGKNSNNWTQWKKLLCFEDAFGLYYTVGAFRFEPITRKIITIKSSDAWDAQVYSAQGYSNNCILTFKAGTTGQAMMVGLDANPSEDANYTKIDFAFYLTNDTTNKTVQIFESGSNVGNFGAYAVGTEFTIEYSAGYVRYYVDGTLKRSIARSISGKLYLDSCIHGNGSIIYDLDFRQSLTKATTAGSADSATKATQDGDGKTISSTYLKLAGGTMSGGITFNKVNNAIAYTGTKATYSMIKFIDNISDEYGNGIAIGGGGLTIIGGGESADTVASGKSGGEEMLYLASDQAVQIITGVQNGLSNAKTFEFKTDGTATFGGQWAGRFTASATSGQVVITDGTTGGIKSSGYTIAKSVPSNADFTNTTYTIATGDSNGQIKVTPSSGSAYNVGVKGLNTMAYENKDDYRKRYLAEFSGNGDSATYCKVCTLTITSSYINGPIEIALQERGRSTVNRLYIMFASVNNSDPSLASFKVLGTYTGYYIYKVTTSKWEVYAAKNEAWSGIWVIDCSLYSIKSPGMTIAWNMENASLPSSGTTQATHIYATSDTNTHRPIQMNGTEILGNNTTALNLKAGSNVSLTNSSGTVTIAATDTTYSGSTTVTLTGTTFSLTKANVTTALGYTPPTTDTNTHRPIQMNGTEILGNNTTVLNLKQGSNVTLTNSSGTVTIAATNTLNTAGSTDTSSKIFLIGATSQAANPQTYSDNEVYATSGVLTTKSVQVGGTAATMQYNSTNHCIDFVVT